MLENQINNLIKWWLSPFFHDFHAVIRDAHLLHGDLGHPSAIFMFMVTMSFL